MSSILRALRKLEEETPPKEGGVFIPDSSHPEGSNTRDSGFSSKKNLIFFGIGLLSLVIASIALMAALSLGPFDKKSLQVSTGPEAQLIDGSGQGSHAEPPGTPSSAARPHQEVATGSADPTTVTGRPRATTSTSRTPSRSPSPSVSQLRKTKPSGQSGTRPSAKPSPRNASTPKAKAQRSRWPDVRPAAPPGEPPKSQTRALRSDKSADFNPPLLASTDLKLQAISWAEAPQQRIAVINGEILNIGEQISGFVVVNIRMNDVILQQNGTMWRMVFNSK